MLTTTRVDPIPTCERPETSIRRLREKGPFDLIGDIHGCADELDKLLRTLGYAGGAGDAPAGHPNLGCGFVHPLGRRVIFLGDLVDRGPKIPQVLKWVMAMVGTGTAFCVPGNHDVKLLRKLQGKEVPIKHGLAESLDQLSRESTEFTEAVAEFVEGLPSHLVLDEGRLVVAHAGVKEAMHGLPDRETRHFALYGETTGEIDEFGLPVRYNWAAEYQGPASVIYGHTPVPEPVWLNRTLNIDTGCVYGGRLTALRYPEGKLVSVRAAQRYAESKRPFFQATS